MKPRDTAGSEGFDSLMDTDDTDSSADFLRRVAHVPEQSLGLVGALAPPPQRIGRFLILDRLGEGGMGQVFSAYDPDLERKVAIKLVRGLARSSPEAIARVKREAQALAKVSHPNVVHVYEVGECEGRVFIVMEIVDGTSLSDWQEVRALSSSEEVTRRLRAYLQAAAGLLGAHGCGLIHRDFKPDNVLVGKDGRVRVADFGLARVLGGVGDVGEAGEGSGDSGPRLTQAGAILGTPGYMSPEQVRGAEADERSDQFSFCAALYEALYGQRAFAGEQFEDYASSVLAGHLRPPPASEVPLVVQQAILRGLSADPAARFPSMQELIAALESGLARASEPLLTRLDKLRLAMAPVAVVAFLELINAAVVALTGLKNSVLRGAAVDAVFIGVTAALLRWPPWPVRHRRRYRSMMFFGMLFLGYFVVGRVAGVLIGVPINEYYTLEAIGAAALFAVEGLRIGWEHVLLGLPMLLYAPFVRLLPDQRIFLQNVILAGMAIGSVYLHMRQPGSDPGPSEPAPAQ